MKNFVHAGIFVIFPVIYIFIIYIFNKSGVFLCWLILLGGGWYFSRALLKDRNKIFNENLKNANIANEILKNAFRKRNLTELERGSVNFTETLSSAPVVLLFFSIGLMLYLDENIFYSGDIFQFALVNVFQYFIFLMTSIGIFLNVRRS